jgi:hypothetical protein
MNNHNKQKQDGLTSQFRGVHYKTDKKKWCARIQYDHKTIFLGYFNTEEEASVVYKKKAEELYGTG